MDPGFSMASRVIDSPSTSFSMATGNPVAIMVSFTSFSILGSVTVPNMMFASG